MKTIHSFLKMLFLIATISLLNTGLTRAQAWYDSDWQYRKPVSIANPGGTPLTEYQVLITLNSSFDFTKAQIDGSDIRITVANGTTIIPFWIENWDAGTQEAYIWVKMPTVPSGGSTAYLYYGNSSAASASEGSNTFSLFDDDWDVPTVTLNPVQVATQPWWEAQVSYPLVFEDNSFPGRDRFHMQYDGHFVIGHAKGYATSPDLINWTPWDNGLSGSDRINPTMGVGYTGNVQYAWGDLFKVDSIYHMYPSRGPGVTVHCQSNDLVHWNDQYGGTVAFDALTSDDPSGIGTGVALLKEADGITPIIVDDKYWMIYFHGFSGGSMYMAYTDVAGDLLTWTTSYSGSPVLVPSGWEGSQLWTPSFTGVNDTYYIYYQGGSPYKIGFASGPASSGGTPLRPDNTTWTKSPNNPVITNTHGWDNGFCQDPVLRCFDGVYYIFYTGDSPWTNGFAYSDSPEGPWTQYGASGGGGTNWTISGNPTVSNGIISFTNTGSSIQSPDTYSEGSALGYKANYKGGSSAYKWVGFIDEVSPPFTNIGVAQTIGTNLILSNYITARGWASLGPLTDSFQIYELVWLTGETRAYVDHSSTAVGTVSTQVPPGPLPVGVRNYSDDTYGLEVDWIYVRKFNDPEPSATFEEEQSLTSLWTGAIDTDWSNPGNWSAGVPESYSKVSIPSAPANQPHVTALAVSPSQCDDLTIESGAVVTIDAGKALTVTGTLLNNAGNTGLVILSDASGTGSLIESNGVNASVNRYLTDDKWHYVSAPVDDPLAGVFLGIYMMEWDEPSGQWTYITDPNYVMSTDMEGFSIWTWDPGTVTFTGNLNTGSKTFNVTNTSGASHNSKGFNFSGNPYPSSVNWNVDDGSGWTRTAGNVDLSLYIWNHDVGNYGVYIKDGSTGTNGVDSIIPPHQGFFVHCSEATGYIGVNNGARVHSSKDILKSGTSFNEPMLKLRVSGNNYADEILFRIDPLASIQYDNLFDALKYRGDEEAPQLYSLSKDSRELSVNAFPVSDDYNVIPLGLEVGLDATYTILITEFIGFDPADNIYLEDVKEGIFTKLNANCTYSFTANPLDEPLRFLLHLNGGLAVPEYLNELINIYSLNKNIYVEVPGNTKGNIVVYNIIGQEVTNTSIKNILNKISLDKSAYYVVKVLSDEGVVTEKVFVK
ncbi:MAG: DUF2341 domain-containing protein [Bacteroidetes bacterium]|nr:DUF2341 domain-containing protein [Bacteroidota bacterium]